MSRTSEITVLLWGGNWWLPGRTEPVPFSSMSEAAAELAGVWSMASRTLRLIYQPDTMRSASVPCPLGNRATVRAALCFEHPQIQDDNVAWGFEPILVDGEDHSTLLHYEERAGLFDLVASLENHGFQVNDAWPLASYLGFLPEEWSEPGGFAVGAIRPGAALCYHHPSNGGRAIQAWQGDKAESQAAEWFGSQAAVRPEDSLLVVFAGEAPASLPANVTAITFADVLSAPVVMPRSHPGQLLPPASVFSAQRAVVAASVLLLFAGGWSGAQYALEYQKAIAHARDEVIEKDRLRGEIDHFRVNQSEIVALKAQLNTPPDLPVCEWLDRLCASLPASIALNRVTVAQGRFTIRGHVDGLDAGVLARWRQGIADSRWMIDPATTEPSGSFNLSGSFVP